MSYSRGSAPAPRPCICLKRRNLRTTRPTMTSKLRAAFVDKYVYVCV